MEQATIEMLKATSLFSGLDGSQLEKIVANGEYRSYKAGENVVRRGETGAGFYLVIDGVLQVRKKGEEVGRLTKGDFFGEMALIKDQPRSADVNALGDATCLVLTSWAFQVLIGCYPTIAKNIMQELARRVLQTQQILSE
jgi:CPA1 family monovalent cation:H+ antiporter